MYCKKNWGSMAEKDPPLGRIDMFQTSPSLRVPQGVYDLLDMDAVQLTGTQPDSIHVYLFPAVLPGQKVPSLSCHFSIPSGMSSPLRSPSFLNP